VLLGATGYDEIDGGDGSDTVSCRYASPWLTWDYGYGAILVTLDREQLECTRGLVESQRPSEALAAL